MRRLPCRLARAEVPRTHFCCKERWDKGFPQTAQAALDRVVSDRLAPVPKDSRHRHLVGREDREVLGNRPCKVGREVAGLARKEEPAAGRRGVEIVLSWWAVEADAGERFSRGAAECFSGSK